MAARNDAKARQWFLKAVDQGVAEAQAMLGVIYANGRGVRQNFAAAAKWFDKATRQERQRAVRSWRHVRPRGGCAAGFWRSKETFPDRL